MKKLLMTISLLLTLGLSASSAAAQVAAPDFEETSDPFVDTGALSVYDRTYTIDFEAAMATAEEEEGDGISLEGFMNVITIQGITFESEDDASAYPTYLLDQVDAATADDPEALEGIEISELDGFDVEGFKVTLDMADLEMTATMHVFVDGNQVFQVMVMDSDLEASVVKANELTQFILDADVQTEDVSLTEDGTSTGGVFDRMPTGDDEIVGDLTSVMDSEIYIAGE